MLRKIKVIGEPASTGVWLDEEPVRGVTGITYHQTVEEIPQVTLDVISHDFNLDLEVADIDFHFKNGWVGVDKCLPEEDVSVLALVKDKYGLHQEVLYRKFFEETDALYEGTYWCSYRTINIESMGISKVIAWQALPSEDFDV